MDGWAMDIEQARTFLAIVEGGSFMAAAERVHVTQSTVSMRIKALEQQLGRSLFERSKSGAALTPAGTQFHKHAVALMRIWQQARLEVALPQGFEMALTVGGNISLWDEFLLDWLHRVRERAPQIAVRAQHAASDQLMQRLIDGSLDLGVMYTPQSRPGFEVERLFEDQLILVSSESRPPVRPGRGYVYVDWGPEFQADHGLSFPELATSGLQLELGSLSLGYVLKHKAAAYFPRRLVAPHLADGTLHSNPAAPTFTYPVYAVYPSLTADGPLRPLLRALRHAASGHNQSVSRLDTPEIRQTSRQSDRAKPA